MKRIINVRSRIIRLGYRQKWSFVWNVMRFYDQQRLIAYRLTAYQTDWNVSAESRKNDCNTKDGRQQLAERNGNNVSCQSDGNRTRVLCLPAKLHLHNSYAVGYRSVSGVSSSHQCRASRALTHSRTRLRAERDARAWIKFRPCGRALK